MQLTNLLREFFDWPFHNHVRRDLSDREGTHRRRWGAEVAEPLRKLLRGAGVHDAAEPGPGVGGGAHRAVLAGDVDRRRCALCWRKTLSGPPRQRKLRMPRFVARDRSVAVLVKQLAVRVDQY